MPVLTKKELERILTDALHLNQPRFKLERSGGRLIGSVISRTFKGKGDFRRQEMIWDVLESELGVASFRRVGTLLAYTPEEWEDPIGAELKHS